MSTATADDSVLTAPLVRAASLSRSPGLAGERRDVFGRELFELATRHFHQDRVVLSNVEANYVAYAAVCDPDPVLGGKVRVGGAV